MTRLAAACCGVCVAVVATGTASSAPTAASRWLPPTEDLSTTGSTDAAVAITQGHLAVAAWSSRSPADGAKVSTRGADHRWGPASTLTSRVLFNLRLAVTGSGLMVLTGVEATDDFSTKTVVAFERAANSTTWKGPIPLDAPAPEQSLWSGPEVAVNDGGVGVAAWQKATQPGELPIIAAALRRADGTWEEPRNLGYGGPEGPRVAIDGHGNALAVWTRDATPDDSVYAESHPAGGAWQSAVLLSDHALVGSANVVMNVRGDALAAWGSHRSDRRFELVSTLRRAGESVWQATLPVSISDPVQALSSYYGLSFVLDERATATLVAARHDGKVDAATSSDGGAWQGPIVLGDAGASSPVLTDSWCVHPEIAQAGTGDTVALWGGAELHAARRLAGSMRWDAPTTISDRPACFALDVAADAQGDAVAVWNASEEAATRLDAAVLDATPPVVSALTVPPVGRLGRPVHMTVTAGDSWSPLVPPLWRFGDGARSRGFRVTHTFRQPGHYRVRVIVADEAGNTATATTAIVERHARSVDGDQLGYLPAGLRRTPTD